MWILQNNSFVSIVEHHDDPTCLVVRARKAGHLEALLGKGVKVKETTDTDYRYRAFCSRQQVADAVARQIKGISYPNFKSSVKDDLLHRLYMQVWEVMLRLQDGVGRYKPWSWPAWRHDDDQPELELTAPPKRGKRKGKRKPVELPIRVDDEPAWCLECDSPAEMAHHCRRGDCPCRPGYDR